MPHFLVLVPITLATAHPSVESIRSIGKQGLDVRLTDRSTVKSSADKHASPHCVVLVDQCALNVQQIRRLNLLKGNQSK